MVVEKYEPIRLATPLLVSKMHAYTNTNNCFEFCKNVLMSEQVHPMFSFVLILYLFLAFAIYWKLIMIVLSKRCNSSPPWRQGFVLLFCGLLLALKNAIGHFVSYRAHVEQKGCHIHRKYYLDCITPVAILQMSLE